MQDFFHQQYVSVVEEEGCLLRFSSNHGPIYKDITWIYPASGQQMFRLGFLKMYSTNPDDLLSEANNSKNIITRITYLHIRHGYPTISYFEGLVHPCSPCRFLQFRKPCNFENLRLFQHLWNTPLNLYQPAIKGFLS